MEDLIHRLRDHAAYAVHDEDDACMEAADMLERLQRLLAEVEWVETAREWGGEGGLLQVGSACLYCRALRPSGHEPDCRLAAVWR